MRAERAQRDPAAAHSAAGFGSPEYSGAQAPMRRFFHARKGHAQRHPFNGGRRGEGASPAGP